MPKPRRLLRLAALSALTLAAGAAAVARPPSAASAAPLGAPVVAHLRAGELRPWLLSGALGPASPRPPETIAREALSSHAPWAATLDLAHVRTVPVGRGARVVAYAQRLDGVPVYARGVRVVVEADGRATTIATALEPSRPASMVARVPASEAERVARTTGKLAAERARTTAIVWPTDGEPRLAWLVEGATRGLPQRPIVVVDAELGTPIAAWDATRTLNLASVYDQNPIKTPTLSAVTLPVLAGLTPADGLRSDHVVAKNCIDKQSLRPVDIGQQVNLHVCDLIPTVKPNADGDYTAIAPPTNEKDPEDPFSELSMFFHANKAWNAANAMGFTAPGVTTPLVAIANFRMNKGLQTGDVAQMQNPNLALTAYDNAFYAAAGQFGSIFGEDGDALWFGQGTRVDFGYDGDVVYHEFGHFVVDHTAQLVGMPHHDGAGVTYSPGAMNEGSADLFSCFITGDPEVGEYAGKGLVGGPIRQLDGDAAFPRAISGEVHEDSLPFSQPIWKLYATLDAPKQEAFRRAFIEALASAPTGDLGYADLAKLLEAAVSKELDAATAKALDDAFVLRGIRPDDPRVIDTDGAPLVGLTYFGFHAPSRSSAGLTPFSPGIVQLRYHTRPGSYALHVTWNYQQSQGEFGSSGLGSDSGKYVPEVLVKVGTSPISFRYGPLRHDAQLVACEDQGDFADCIVPVEIAAADADADADAGLATVYVMAVNGGTLDVDVNNIAIETPRAPKPVDAGTTVPDAPVGPRAQPDPGEVSGSGCACSLPGAHGGARTSSGASSVAAASFATLALGLFAARRRRR
jgi:hypothetical protein